MAFLVHKDPPETMAILDLPDLMVMEKPVHLESQVYQALTVSLVLLVFLASVEAMASLVHLVLPAHMESRECRAFKVNEDYLELMGREVSPRFSLD